MKKTSIIGYMLFTLLAVATIAQAQTIGNTIDLSDISFPASGPGWAYSTPGVSGGVYTVDRDVTIKGATTLERVEVASGSNVTVTLQDASIISSASAFYILHDAFVNLKLNGVNELTSGAPYAGLQVAGDEYMVGNDATLVVHDGISGKLTATGGGIGAGIGGGDNKNCGYIVIAGGEIIALSGGSGGAAIGSCSGESYPSILITGGKVNATSSGSGAAIGGGNGGYGAFITITGGDITAYSGTGAAIGGGENGNIDFITITDGNITAISTDASGIGGGNGAAGGYGGTITLSGGTINAQGGDVCPGIGGNYDYGLGSSFITINGGTIDATGGQFGGAGIGSGNGAINNTIPNIIIYGSAVVTATGGDENSTSYPAGAGIGTGGDCPLLKDLPPSIIIVSPASVTATGGNGNMYSNGANIGHGATTTPSLHGGTEFTYATTFETVKITAIAGTGGDISPLGDTLVAQFANQVFFVTASPGYEIVRVYHPYDNPQIIIPLNNKEWLAVIAHTFYEGPIIALFQEIEINPGAIIEKNGRYGSRSGQAFDMPKVTSNVSTYEPLRWNIYVGYQNLTWRDLRGSNRAPSSSGTYFYSTDESFQYSNDHDTDDPYTVINDPYLLWYQQQLGYTINAPYKYSNVEVEDFLAVGNINNAECSPQEYIAASIRILRVVGRDESKSFQPLVDTNFLMSAPPEPVDRYFSDLYFYDSWLNVQYRGLTLGEFVDQMINEGQFPSSYTVSDILTVDYVDNKSTPFATNPSDTRQIAHFKLNLGNLFFDNTSAPLELYDMYGSTYYSPQIFYMQDAKNLPFAYWIYFDTQASNAIFDKGYYNFTNEATLRHSSGASSGPHSAAAPVVQLKVAGVGNVVSSDINPSILGTNVTFTATIYGDIGTPTGAVQFIVDGLEAGVPVPLNNAGLAEKTISTLTTGDHTITAMYSGNLVYSSSISAPYIQTVNMANSTTNIIAFNIPSPFTDPQAITVSAMVIPNPVSPFTPTGVVAFYLDNDTKPFDYGGLDALGMTTINTTMSFTPGLHAITAKYLGDNNFNPSDITPSQSFVIYSAKPSFANLSDIIKIYGDPTFTLPSVSGGPGTGAYSYRSSNPAIASVNASTGQVTVVSVGDAFMFVKRLGSGSFADSPESDPIKVTVLPKPVTVTGITAIKAFDGTDIFTNDQIDITGAVINGIIGSDNVTISKADITGSFGPAVGSGTLTVSGNFVLEGTDAKNYILTTQPIVMATITASPSPVVITANSGSSYYGDSPTNPGLSISGATGSLANDILSRLFNNFAITSSTPAGVYALTVGGTFPDNYAILTVPGEWIVNKLPLTIAAVNKTIAYGETPVLEYQIVSGSLIHGDVLSGALSVVPPYTVGEHTITQGTLTAGNNYNITFIAGTLTVQSSNNTVGDVIVGGEITDRVDNHFYTSVPCGEDSIEVSVTTDAFATVHINSYPLNPRKIYLPNYGDNTIYITVTSQSGDTESYTLTVYKFVPLQVAFFDRFSDILTVPSIIAGIGVVQSVEWYRDGILLGRDPTKGYLDMTEAGVYYAVINGTLRTCEVVKTRSTTALTMTVYPNPVYANQEVTITINRTDDELRNAQLQFHSIEGRMLKTLPVTSAKLKVMTPPHQGVVALKLITNTGNKEVKLIVK